MSTVFKHIDIQSILISKSWIQQFYKCIFRISFGVQYVMFLLFSARVLLKVTCLPIDGELVYKLLRQKMLNALITSLPSGLKLISIQILRSVSQKAAGARSTDLCLRIITCPWPLSLNLSSRFT